MKEQIGNTLWSETDSRGVVKIGFNREYIETKLGECFHVMQADRKFARKGQPLLVLETNDAVERLPSPVTGTIITFNHKASDFPDRLSTEDIILEILPEGVKLSAKTKKQPATKTVWNDEQAEREWFQQQMNHAQWNNAIVREADRVLVQPPPPPPNAEALTQERVRNILAERGRHRRAR